MFDNTTAWAIALTVTLVLVLCVERLLTRRFDPLAPPIAFSLFMFLGYVLPYPFMIADLDPFSLFWPYDYSDRSRAVTLALIIATAAVLAFYAGYNVAYRGAFRYTALPDISLDGRSLQRVSGVFLAISLMLGAVGIYLLGGLSALFEGLGDRTRLFAGLNYFFSALTVPLGVALIYWVITLSKRRLPTLPYWIFATSAAFVVALTGAKSTIYVFILSALVIYHYLYKRVPAWKMAVMGLLLFCLLMAYQVLVREYLVVGEVVSVEVDSSAKRDIAVFLIDQFTGNFMQLQCMSIIVDALDRSLPMQWGSTLAALLTAPIPSAIFPDKPLTAPGVFTIALWPGRWFDEGTTLPPGLLGELYLNFGLVGVLVGSLLWGASYGWAFRKTFSGGLRPTRLIGYALYLSLMLHYLRGEFASPTVLLLILLLPIWLACKYSQQSISPSPAL